MLRITGRLVSIDCLPLLSSAWGRIWFRPRVMRDVNTIDFSTHILGHPTKMPIYIVYVPSAVLRYTSC